MSPPRNAFGIEARRVDDDAAARAIANRGTLAAEIDVIHAHACRDAAIIAASGRWVPGRPDPDSYVPGDAVAVRSLGIAGDLISLRRNLALLEPTPLTAAQHEARLGVAASTILALDELRALYDAVPHWLDAPTAAGILDSTPPPPDVLAELRLPYPRVLVCFGRRFDLPAELCDWPRAWDHSPDPLSRGRGRRSALGDIRALGGALEGVVLTEHPGGGLADQVIWLVSANPNPALPMPLALDRYRAIVWGRLRSSRLAHVARNLAAAVCWAEWRQPNRTLRLPDDIGSRPWRKAIRRGEFRRHEPTGAAAGVHVIDLKRTTVDRDRRPRSPDGDPGRRPPTTHLRRAHWRLQPVGPGRTERRLVRVAATVVAAGVGAPATPIYRVPTGNTAAPERPPAKPSVPVDPAHHAEVIDLRTIPLRRPQPEPPERPRPATPEVTL